MADTKDLNPVNLNSCANCKYAKKSKFNDYSFTLCTYPMPFFALPETMVVSEYNHPPCLVKQIVSEDLTGT